MSLIDRQFFHELTLDSAHKVKWTASSISVHSLRTATHQVNEYITLDIYLSGTDRRTAHVSDEFHLVNNLKINMLIETNILTVKKITVKLQSKDSTAVIESCQNVIISLYITTRSNACTNWAVTSNEYTVISPQAQIAVLITSFSEAELLNDRDLLFESENVSTELAVYALIINHTMSEVLVYNEFKNSVILLQKTHLSQIIEYETDSCYSAHSDASLLTAQKTHSKNTENWVCRGFWSILTSVTAFNVVTNDAFTVNPSLSSESLTENLLTNRITVCSDSDNLYWITEVISQYPQLWEDWDNIVDVSESE